MARRSQKRSGQVLVGPLRDGSYETATLVGKRKVRFSDGSVETVPSRAIAKLSKIPRRNRNPALIPFALGAVSGAGIVFFRVGGSVAAEHEFMELTDCEGGIILFKPRRKSAWERGIDFATGATGYSHCGLYLCMRDNDNNPLIVDCQSKVGVQIRGLKDFTSRQVAWIPLSSSDTAHARGAALARLGMPYRGRPGGLTCSEFVEACMPMRIRQRIRSVSRAVTPNTIARAFDVKGPGPSASELAERLKF